MKHTFAGLDHLLGQVAVKLSQGLSFDIQGSLNVIYFPQLGFLTTVPLDPETGNGIYEGNLENPWERKFSTEYTSPFRYNPQLCALTCSREQVYFKNSEMREMDDHFGDLYGSITGL